MKRTLLKAYQWITGLSDTSTGIMLCLAPEFTVRMMGLHAPEDAAPYIGYIGAFVLSVGLGCLYGVRVISRPAMAPRLQMIWLLTAIPRAAVAIYILGAIASGALELGWLSVVVFDGACVVIQAIGLRKRWYVDAR